MLQSLPLVSVLMTAYNREKYIAEAIKSVLESTYKNFELIIVDDGSKDETANIARGFTDLDDRIKFYINKKNLGQFKNRNYIASLAKGKYIKYVDSDDLMYPYGLEVLVNMMEKFPTAGYGLCSLGQDNKKIFPFMLNPLASYEYNYFYKSIFQKAPLSSIIVKEAFDAIGGFDIEAVAGDYGFWLKIAQLYPVVLMPDGIVWYRDHKEGEMQKARNSHIMGFEYFKVEELYLSGNTVLSDTTKKSLLKKNKNRQLKRVFDFFVRGKIKSGWELFKFHRTPPQMYFKEKQKMANEA